MIILSVPVMAFGEATPRFLRAATRKYILSYSQPLRSRRIQRVSYRRIL